MTQSVRQCLDDMIPSAPPRWRSAGGRPDHASPDVVAGLRSCEQCLAYLRIFTDTPWRSRTETNQRLDEVELKQFGRSIRSPD